MPALQLGKLFFEVMLAIASIAAAFNPITYEGRFQDSSEPASIVQWNPARPLLISTALFLGVEAITTIAVISTSLNGNQEEEVSEIPPAPESYIPIPQTPNVVAARQPVKPQVLASTAVATTPSSVFSEDDLIAAITAEPENSDSSLEELWGIDD